MRQKIQDLLTLLKKDRKTQVIGAAIAMILIFLVLGDDGASKHTAVKRPDLKKQGAGAMGNKEAYSDLVTSFKSDLETIKAITQDNKTQIGEVRQKNKEYEERTAEIFKRILERMAETESAVMNSNNVGGSTTVELGNIPGQTGGANMQNVSQAPSGFSQGGSIGQMAAKALAAGGKQRQDGSVVARDGTVYTPEGRVIRPDGTVTEVSSYEGNTAETDELSSFGMDDNIVAPPQIPEKEKLAIVGAGDSVRVKLLAGVNAPTDGTPYPVVFKLTSDVYGPDGSALPLGEARLIAAAQGSLTDSRALFRLSSLNIRLPDGRRKVIPVDGWVVGEDGIRGMAGVTIDPIGKAIGGAIMVGGLDGIGQAMSDQQVTHNTNAWGGTQEMVTGSEAQYAAGRALSGGAREWGNIIKQRLQMLVPHVEVLSGREATAVFSKSFVIKDLYNALADDNQHFASLD